VVVRDPNYVAGALARVNIILSVLTASVGREELIGGRKAVALIPNDSDTSPTVWIDESTLWPIQLDFTSQKGELLARESTSAINEGTVVRPAQTACTA
jgi:hypothetical protein